MDRWREPDPPHVESSFESLLAQRFERHIVPQRWETFPAKTGCRLARLRSSVVQMRRSLQGTAPEERRRSCPMAQVRIMFWKDIPYGVRASDGTSKPVSRQLPSE